MSTKRLPQPAPNSAAVAQRLLAHARLCEQIAQGCWNEETAAKLRSMARDCTRAAAQVTPTRDAASPTAH